MWTLYFAAELLHSPVSSALLHGTRAVGASQTLRRGTRKAADNGMPFLHTCIRRPSRGTSVPHFLAFFMAALRSKCGHYIFALWFLSSFFHLFPRLISAAADWMSTILPHISLMWPYSADLECRSEMCCKRLAGNTGYS